MQTKESVNILLVDDRKENLLALEKLLEAPDLTIMKAVSGNDALALALEHDFALVLMDVQMPEMDGFETAELMRGTEHTRKIPIIFVTAISKEQKHVFKGYESGAVDYLFKPLDPDILMAKVNIFLSLHRQKMALQRANEGLRVANRKILDQQKALLEEERLKVLLQMAGATAHELNQPLMALLGAIELMAMVKDDPEKLIQHADKAKTAGEKIAEIVKSIQTIRRDEIMSYAGGVELIQFDQKIQALSIDDSMTDFMAIQSLLAEEASIDLDHVTDIEMAFNALKNNPYDLILIDHMLGEETGEDFLKRAARKKIDIPVIVVTGQGDEMIASRMIQAGASGYLTKAGLSRSLLTREIQQALEKAKLRKEVRKAQRQLADMSIRDYLTNLYNRRYFKEVLERECYRAERDHAAFSVCIMDLDFFKAINDTYGHSAGDAVLVETARLLSSSFRKGDVICRYGGEEFAVILYQTDIQKALAACETFRSALENKIVDHDGNSLQVTVSIGIETYDGRLAKTPGELIDQADQALYKAKKAGRNRVVSNKAM